MSANSSPGRQRVNENLPNAGAHRREIAQALNSTISGAIDCTRKVTLNANATTTVVYDPRASAQSHVMISPMTADAAAELASGRMYWVCSGSAPGLSGTITFVHRNLATTGRTFTLALLG